MSKEMSADEYKRFQQVLEKSSGILLGNGKEYLVTSRLRRLMEREAIGSVGDLVTTMERNRTLMESVVDAMTTNETLWFRDDHPYRIFREKLLPELAKNRRPLKVWSAALFDRAGTLFAEY